MEVKEIGEIKKGGGEEGTGGEVGGEEEEEEEEGGVQAIISCTGIILNKYSFKHILLT
jgi:hypothetical protein